VAPRWPAWSVFHVLLYLSLNLTQGLGLIRWKLVIHAFADGHARFVVGIQVNPNNKAATVFNLFLCATAKHGTPYHVRGDHGVENVLVADYMEDARGPGGYIWGR